MNLNSDLFELYLAIKEMNITLTTLATIEILRERRESGMIDPDKYKELLDILADRLIKPNA